ncbi:MAG: hypothetical protein V3U30_04995 [Thermoplasmata archaeon]
MRVAEDVPGHVLILQVGSRSRPGQVFHFLTVFFDESGDIAGIGCSCESFRFRGYCHHATSARDLMGASA